MASPPTPFEDDREGPKIRPLPEGIDCQRCHGPGQAHVDAVKARRPRSGPAGDCEPRETQPRAAARNVHAVSPRVDEQPAAVSDSRYEHPPFSSTPGKPLSDYFIHFDHAPGTRSRRQVRDRRRRVPSAQVGVLSAQRDDVPHLPRPARYSARRQGGGALRGGLPELPSDAASRRRAAGGGRGSSATCVDCHMPKRRAEDAVHVVMTDHYIQRQRPRRDLLAAADRGRQSQHGDYRGEVASTTRRRCRRRRRTNLYLALAQVQQGSNLSAGIRRLEQAIEKHRPARAGVLLRARSRVLEERRS